MNILKKTVKFVKEQMFDAKRGIAMAKAKKEISIFYVLDQRLGSFEGQEVYRDDVAVQAITGAYGYEPNAIFVDGKIVVNTAFESIPPEYQEAVFFHELGHIQNNHQPNQLMYFIQSHLGCGYAMKIEYEADEFSALKGAKMLEALVYLTEQFPQYQNRSVALRIKRLKVLGNVC